MENVYIAYNYSHFAIYLPKLIKLRGNWKFDEVMTETKMHSFFATRCSSILHFSCSFHISVLQLLFSWFTCLCVCTFCANGDNTNNSRVGKNAAMSYNISVAVQGEELELQKIMPLIHPSRHFSGEMISNSFRKC